MDTRTQIEKHLLVSPSSGDTLVISDDGEWLQTEDGREVYPFLNGNVPVLLKDQEWAKQYVRDATQMLAEYESEKPSAAVASPPAGNGKASLEMPASREALARVLSELREDMLCLSVGGGPSRIHPMVRNVNIGAFPNVELVADAHVLPYKDNCVDFIYCASVLEHLYSPEAAVSEMFRVLRPGGKAYLNTPFTFVYHGYPHHYQNLTLTGHRALFERAGFRVLDSGVSFGPAYALTQMINQFIRHYTRGISKWVLHRVWRLWVPLIRRIDRRVEQQENAHLLAAMTYLVVEKP
ncbi:MAG: methyltransferase domain-containing protein [Nitrospirota bacterium]|nr:methyltransferase domain-containing protein [Nitrospirota bacterium]